MTNNLRGFNYRIKLQLELKISIVELLFGINRVRSMQLLLHGDCFGMKSIEISLVCVQFKPPLEEN